MSNFDEYSEEEILSEEDYFETFQKNNTTRRVISAIHLILTVAAFIGCVIWRDDLLMGAIVYSIGYIILHAIIGKIPNIGYYKPGYYEVWNGNDCIHVADENHVEFYGFGSIGFEVLIEVVIYGVVAALLSAFLPKVMGYAAILGVLIVLLLKCLIIPTISDIVNIISKRNHGSIVDDSGSLISYGVIGLVVVFIVGCCVIFPFTSAKNLDVNKAVDSYYTKYDHKINPVEDADLNGGKPKFKFFNARCSYKKEADFDFKNGMIKKGEVRVELEYMLTHWEAERITPAFSSVIVNSPVSFTSEEEVELADYKAPSIVSFTVNKFDGENGSGKLTVTEKETKKVVYSSDFTIEPSYGLSHDSILLKVILKDPIRFEFFGFGSLEMEWHIEEDTIELETFGKELKYKSE